MSFLYLLHMGKLKNQEATIILVQTPAFSHILLCVISVLAILHVIPDTLFSYCQYLHVVQSPYKFLI